MARTSINLVGNCLATAVMARWEGELGTPGTPVLDAAAGQPLTVPAVAPAGEPHGHG
jgi:proton glutamate symport protein